MSRRTGEKLCVVSVWRNGREVSPYDVGRFSVPARQRAPDYLLHPIFETFYVRERFVRGDSRHQTDEWSMFYSICIDGGSRRLSPQRQRVWTHLGPGRADKQVGGVWLIKPLFYYLNKGWTLFFSTVRRECMVTFPFYILLQKSSIDRYMWGVRVYVYAKLDRWGETP